MQLNSRIVSNRVIKFDLQIQLVEFCFPSQEAGLPDGRKNMDTISLEMVMDFIKAVDLLQQPIEQYLQEQQPRPSCIISDSSLPWMFETASKFEILRIFFHGMYCFSLLCLHKTHHYKSHKNVAFESEPVDVPSLPHRIEIPKSQLLYGNKQKFDLQKLLSRSIDVDAKCYSVVVNSFSELENEYLEYYQKALGKKV
ncbi:UDP-glycosyltransferase 73D1-like [Magnolia sinica]|uniref:UDP-glycosyltransferase 73D1-like n=1 Tax=Magnolia sinica TaxID=86752 RepID=UPI00265AC7F0|nr:UDP-glycosyltransferase 73D1-like [Magnolia sinica]